MSDTQTNTDKANAAQSDWLGNEPTSFVEPDTQAKSPEGTNPALTLQNSKKTKDLTALKKQEKEKRRKQDENN